MIKAFLFFLLVGLASSQTITYLHGWDQGPDNLAGVEGEIQILGDQNTTCFVTFPLNVELFHAAKLFSVPGRSNVGNNEYAVAGAPTDQWGEAVNGTFRFLLFFMNGTDGNADFFNYTDIDVVCSGEVDNLGVSNFPNNLEKTSAGAVLLKRDGYHKGDIISVTFPQPVTNVTVTTNSENLVSDWEEGAISFSITGFTEAKTGEGATDAMKQVEIKFKYAGQWFSSAEVSFEVNNPNAAENNDEDNDNVEDGDI